MTDPGPGQPLTDDEARAWVDAVDKITGHYLGDLTLEQMEELAASVQGQCAGNDWAEEIADAIRARWRVQRGDHLKAVWEQIKRNT